MMSDKKSPAAATVFVLFSLLFYSCSAQNEKYATLPPAEFSEKIKTEPGIVLDVRTPKEFINGHIANAININLFDDDFSQQVLKLDSAKAIYVYCASGGRSSEAAELLSKSGYKKVTNLKRGITAWKESNMPVEK